MKDLVKDLVNEVRMPGLSGKQRAIMWYFCISFCALCITDDAPFWAIILVLLNFVNAVRLAKKIDFAVFEESKECML